MVQSDNKAKKGFVDVLHDAESVLKLLLSGADGQAVTMPPSHF